MANYLFILNDAPYGSERSYNGTLGFERRWNPILTLEKDDFVAALTRELPPRPAEMERMVAFNLGA